MAVAGAFDRILTLIILGLIAWMIYESWRGNNILNRFVGQKNNVDLGGKQFGIRKH